MSLIPSRVSSDPIAAFCASAILITLASNATSTVRADRPKGSVLLFGSSSMNGSFGHLIADDLTRLGFQIERRGYAAAGLARPDFRDLHETLAQCRIDRSTAAVVFYVGANDGQSLWLSPEERQEQESPWVGWHDERWSSIYEARATKLIRSVCARGARNAIVLPPADVPSERLQSRLDRIRPLLQRAARATDCGRFVPTTGDRGRFFIDGEALRSADSVHMTRPGAQRVWERIRNVILALMLPRS
jgi:hypothetical protein